MRVLLQGRTSEDPTAAQLRQWQTELGTLAVDDELWLIGGDALGELHHTTVAIRDPLEHERRLTVRLNRRAKSRCELTLELPSNGDCARLLRDPFSLGVAAPPAQSVTLTAPPESNPQFSSDGRRLFLRLANGALAWLPVPRSPREPAGLPTHFHPPAGERIVAAGQQKNRLLAVTVAPETRIVSCYGVGKKGGIVEAQRLRPLPQSERLPVAGPRLGRCLGRSRAPHPEHPLVSFTDGQDWLFQLGDTHLQSGPQVSALRLVDHAPLYLASPPQRPAEPQRRVFRWRDGAFHADGPLLEAGGGMGGFFVGTRRDESLIAVPHGQSWQLHSLLARTQPTTVALPADARVVAGFLPAGTAVVIGRDGRTISIVSRAGAQTLAASAADIRHATLSDQGQMLAYVSDDGQLVVLSTRDGSELLRRRAGAAQ